jgi:protein TonB
MPSKTEIPGTVHTGKSVFGALGVACVLELLLVGAAAAVIVQAKAEVRAAEAPILLAFDEPKPPEVKPRPPPPKPPKPPKPVKEVKPLPVKQVQHTPQARPLPQPVPTLVETPAPPAPSVIAEAPPPHPAPPAPVHDHSGEKEAEFATRLKASIQAAVVYPAAARNMGFSGRARVEFLFRDGVISHLRIIQGSGSGMIDQAALASVSNALIPPIPESLRGHETSYQVTVEFRLDR